MLGRAEELPFPDASFDALTVTYLLRYVDDPGATLRELARVVRPGGVVASLEFGVPPSPVWRARVVGLHAARDARDRVVRVSRVARGRAGSSGRASRRSGAGTRSPNSSVCGRAAGLSPVRVRRMSLGGGVVLWAVREG